MANDDDDDDDDGDDNDDAYTTRRGQGQTWWDRAQTDRKTDSQPDSGTDRERPSTDRADRAETYLKKLQLHTQSEWAIAGKRSRVGAGATTCGNHET